MSSSIEIFVASIEPGDVFAEVLSEALDLNFERQAETAFTGAPLYKYTDSISRWIEVSVHTLENDGPLKFEDYKYLIQIGVFSNQDQSDQELKLKQLGEWVFDRLKALDNYALLMTYDIQKPLGSYTPKDSGSSPEPSTP